MDFKSQVTQNGVRLDGYTGLVDLDGNPLTQRSNLQLLTRQGYGLDDPTNDQTVFRFGHPRYNPHIRDEFIRGDTASGTVGELGWFTAVDTTPSYLPTTNHPGMYVPATGAVSGNTSIIALRPLGTSPVMFVVNDPWDMYWIVRPSSFDSDTQLYFGVSSSLVVANLKAGTIATAGAGFKKDFADTSIYGFVDVSGVRTVSSPAVQASVTSSTYYRWRMRRISASTIGFTVNEGTEIVVTATPPSGTAVCPYLMITTQAAASKSCFIDYFDLSFGLPGNTVGFVR